MPGSLKALGGRRRPPAVEDLAIASVLWVLDLQLSFDPNNPQARSITWVALYSALGYLALGGRRRWPGPTFLVLLGHSLLAAAFFPGYLPTLGLWFALYTLAARSELRWAILGLLSMSGQIAFNVMDEIQRHPGREQAGAVTSSIVLSIGVNGAIFGVGRWVRWSARQRPLIAERAAAEAISSERNRIARDLHDVVAHSVTLMILQAGGAARLLRSDPGRAEVALSHVDKLGQQAIFELHRFLGLLVPNPIGPTGLSAPPFSPPGLQDLPELVDQVRASGVNVELVVTGEPTDLEPGVDLSAFLISQEALTNAARYADPQCPVQVNVCWQPAAVRIQVVNRTRRDPGDSLSTSHGIIGIRERVRICGGSIEVGLQLDGRFLLDVHLPLIASRSVARPEIVPRGGF